MTIKELREKTDKELSDLLASTRDAIRVLRFRLASKETKNVRDARKSKQLVARILTCIAERKAL